MELSCWTWTWMSRAAAPRRPWGAVQPLHPRAPGLCQQPVHTGSPGKPAPPPHVHYERCPDSSSTWDSVPGVAPAWSWPSSPLSSQPSSQELSLSSPSVTVSHCVTSCHQRIFESYETPGTSRGIRTDRYLWSFCSGDGSHLPKPARLRPGKLGARPRWGWEFRCGCLGSRAGLLGLDTTQARATTPI